MLPGGNKLVRNFYDTKKILSKLELPREKIHACKNHCMLFYGKVDSVLTKCKVCGHSRYKKGGRNNVPNLVLTYFPIAPRLQRMYMSKKMSKEMTWHYDHKTDSNKMVHPSDGKAWKHFDSTHSTFSKEIRNVRLGLCTDGFNPNNSNSNPYSLWPVFLTIYNLPPWMSLKDAHVKLSLVIPGRKNPGQNLDVFLQPLIKELKTLWNDGVETYDAYRKNNFNMKATLLWTVSDFPAYAMLSGWSTHGKLACPYCMGNVDSFQLHNGGKPCWFDCHRRFLPARHPYRRDRKGFLAQKSVFAGPPPHLTGYFVNGYKFHTLKHGDGWVTHNSGVCVKGSTYNEFEFDYYGLLVEVLEVNYCDSNGRCVVVLFKCDWFEPIQGVRVNRKHNLVDIRYKSKGCQNDLFILASQAEQVYYAPYPSMTKDLKDWWVVVKATLRSINEVTQCSSDVVDDNVDVEEFFQENEMTMCSNKTDANANTEIISLVTQGEIEEVGDLDVGNSYMEVSENEEEFIDTYDNLEVSEAEEEFIDTYDDSDDDNELALSYHSSDKDEARYAGIMARGNNSKGRGRGRERVRNGNKGIGGSSNVSEFVNQDADYDDGRSGRKGSGISRNTCIGGSSNVSEFVDQDVDYDDGRSEGRGRGRSENIVIGGDSSNASGFSNQEYANNDDGSRSGSGGRGRGISGNIGIGGSSSNVSGFRNQNADYDNGSRSGGRGRGISGNIGGRGSSSTSGFGNPGADFDTNDNETETETSQRVRGSNLVQSIPNHPSQRPMITLYYGGFAEPHVTRDIISIFKVMFYGPWATWREVDQESRDYMFEEFQDLYQWHPSENAAVYKAWERVMSSRYSDILGQCRRDAAHRATMDNITVGNDLSVLKPYTPSWIDQAHWDNMIDRL
ncbi:putative transposase-associated domain-containing protein, partial [Tanacetum coccineum]